MFLTTTLISAPRLLYPILDMCFHNFKDKVESLAEPLHEKIYGFNLIVLPYRIGLLWTNST